MTHFSHHFWHHLVDDHGMNPDTSQAPGVEFAALHFDLTHGGGCTLEMIAKDLLRYSRRLRY